MVVQLRTEDTYAVDPRPVVATDRVIVDAFERYRPELHSFLRRSTRDPSAAEDLLQEAFLRLTREVHAGRAPENPRAWLYQVAGNLAISRARRAAVALRWIQKMATFERARRADESPEASLLEHDRTREMERVLAAQSAELRTALLMAGQGFSGREIAAALGRSETATRTLLSRGRLRIRHALEVVEASQ
jgi:RNA polymerase sigma-70 factor (ECF subfamily)